MLNNAQQLLFHWNLIKGQPYCNATVASVEQTVGLVQFESGYTVSKSGSIKCILYEVKGVKWLL